MDEIKTWFKRVDFKTILIIALLVRLLLAPLSFHSDLTNNAIWGTYAQNFGLRGFYDWLNFGNYARPDYPPLAMIMFLLVRWVWQIFFNFFWKLNITIGLFPSKFIPWFETSGYLFLIKIPGILADLGIGYLIYKLVKKKKNEFAAKVASSLFLFNLPVIYLSSSWGQLDSIVAFLGLLTTMVLLNKRYLLAISSFFVSLMIKVTMAAATPIFIIQGLKDRITIKRILIIASVLIGYSLLLGNLFIDKSPLSWLIITYWKKFVPGAVTLPYLNLNAFNFWGLIFGLERLPDTTPFLGIPLNVWAWVISSAFFLLIFYKFWKGQNIFFSLLMIFFTAFMFLPRVHERYLYSVFVFFPLILIEKKKLMKTFLVLSFVFLINLYHWWWVPRIDILVNLFDYEIVERVFSFANLFIFGHMLKVYLKEKRVSR